MIEEYTYTDTFGGELDYSWVRKVKARNIREAKKLLGLENVRFRKYGADMWRGIGHCTAICVDPFDL